MAVIKYKVIEVTKEFDGNTCEVLSEAISVHKNFMKGVFTFSAQKELKKDEEFQQTKEIDMILPKDLKAASLKEINEIKDFNIKMNKEYPWWSV